MVNLEDNSIPPSQAISAELWGRFLLEIIVGRLHVCRNLTLVIYLGSSIRDLGELTLFGEMQSRVLESSDVICF